MFSTTKFSIPMSFDSYYIHEKGLSSLSPYIPLSAKSHGSLRLKIRMIGKRGSISPLPHEFSILPLSECRGDIPARMSSNIMSYATSRDEIPFLCFSHQDVQEPPYRTASCRFLNRTKKLRKPRLLTIWTTTEAAQDSFVARAYGSKQLGKTQH